MRPQWFLLGVLVGLLLVCAAHSQQGELKKYASAEGKFEILLPETPKVKKKGDATTVSWEKDGEGIAVSFGPLPVIADKNPANRDKMLAAMSEEAAKSLKADIGERKKLMLFGNPGLQWNGTVKESGNEAQVRTYLIGQRFYQIIALGKPGFLQSETAKKTLESFRLTK